MSANLGLRVSDATQWALFEEGAKRVLPFVSFLKKTAANAKTAHVDDTHNIILGLVKGCEEAQEVARLAGKKPDEVRTGIHTTNLTAVFLQGTLVLYKSGLHHAGEILARVLECRTVEDEILVMADASSANTSKLRDINAKVTMGNCNSHSVRKAKELAEAGDERVHGFLHAYGTLFQNDKETQTLSPAARLAFHARESLPVMSSMRDGILRAFDSKEVEPNSALGKAYNYFLRHFHELSAFCRIENAPISNDLAERMLKCVIRHRRNSLFFKTEVGAAVADIYTTILFTAQANGLNSIAYLTHLLKHHNHWKNNPEAWLPWNYPETIKTPSPQRLNDTTAFSFSKIDTDPRLRHLARQHQTDVLEGHVVLG